MKSLLTLSFESLHSNKIVKDNFKKTEDYDKLTDIIQIPTHLLEEYKEFLEENEELRWHLHSYCLEAVKEDGFTLQLVKEQTEEICLAAVRQDGRALEYVKVLTDKIRLAAN